MPRILGLHILPLRSPGTRPAATPIRLLNLESSIAQVSGELS
jgi:hypothetical protein